ncbi:MAG: hypothetical protein HKN17_03300 [Rhodothermales bacterium]|nr:hypothetical protein [Rhodothermales bacterium]
MGLKELFLQKGWAGRTISREETVDRLNPIIRIMTEMLHRYAAVRDASDADERREIERVMKTLRADIGKMAETVFSCGGTAYSGTELDPDDFAADSDGFMRVLEAEDAFASALAEEKDIEHQMRTRAILAKVAENHDDRMNLLRSHA